MTNRRFSRRNHQNLQTSLFDDDINLLGLETATKELLEAKTLAKRRENHRLCYGIQHVHGHEQRSPSNARPQNLREQPLGDDCSAAPEEIFLIPFVVAIILRLHVRSHQVIYLVACSFCSGVLTQLDYLAWQRECVKENK